MSASGLHPMVTITGPTGAGKTDLALALAGLFPAEIVNCDSLQLYRGLDIGTAKPSPEDRARIPHHLIDFLRPDEIFSAGEYAVRGREILRQIASRRRLPLVVGGTGFYLKALLEGLAEGPRRDSALRENLASREAARPGALHRLLKRLDPKAAGRIHPGDVQKLIRYLEIGILTRRAPSEIFTAGRSPLEGFAALKILLNPPRAALRDRIRVRTARIFDAGLVDEVRRLLDQGVPMAAKAFESIGYKEALAVLRGEMSMQAAKLATEIATRQYAKRQVTWFRRDCHHLVIEDFGDSPAALDLARLAINQHLAQFPLAE